MQGTGRGSEHRRHSVLPPTPTQIWKQTGTGLRGGEGVLVCVHMLHLETQMPRNDEFLHQCMFFLQRVHEIDRNQLQHKYKRREIWLRRREAKFIVFPNPQVRSEDTDQIRGWLSENLTAPPPLFTVAHNCYSRKKGCFSSANLWHFIPFS